jgi:hypothetical protein
MAVFPIIDPPTDSCAYELSKRPLGKGFPKQLRSINQNIAERHCKMQSARIESLSEYFALKLAVFLRPDSSTFIPPSLPMEFKARLLTLFIVIGVGSYSPAKEGENNPMPKGFAEPVVFTLAVGRQGIHQRLPLGSHRETPHEKIYYVVVDRSLDRSECARRGGPNRYRSP